MGVIAVTRWGMGQAMPVRGQNPMLQNQIRQGQARQNQMRAGRFSQNRMLQGQFPQNRMPQGQMPFAAGGQSPQRQNPPTQNPDITFEPLYGNEENVLPQGVAPSAAAMERPDVLASRLAAFAQDERNGAEFYRELAGMAGSEWDRSLLEELSDNSLSRSATAATIVRESGGLCEIRAKAAGDGKLRYGDGVAMAVRQESRTIDELAAMLEMTEDARRAREINALLARKMGDFGKLLLLR